jgi:hypothetical protein
MAQVQYILDSAAKKKVNPKAIGELDGSSFQELIEVCKRWKAKLILDARCAFYRVKKRTQRRPTQSGDKLRLKAKEIPTEVILVKKVGKHQKGEFAILKEIHEYIEDDGFGAKKKKRYTYDLEFKGGEIIKEVARANFATYYYKDGNVMKDILVARGAYKCVIKQLTAKFSGEKLEGKEFDETLYDDEERSDEEGQNEEF